MGTLYGIGVGPGNPEYMTLQAVRIIKECSVIAIPDSEAEKSVALHIAKQAIPEIMEKKIISVTMPMVKDKEILEKAHQEAADKLLYYLNNTDVAFITIGDVSIYSTYLYLHKKVRAAGIKTIMVPGIPSFCAAAAAFNDSLVEGDEMLHLIPASYDLASSMQLTGTKVFMKAGKKFPQLKDHLRKSKSAKMIENCGLPTEKIYPSLGDFPEKAGYLSLIVVKE
jgi:precorrin-2/cobalt-factor-2 C20-methyltransferase